VTSAYDAIVIGAGVMGASLAFHLARAGQHNTLVLEREAVCSGNTRKSGALVRTHYSNLPEARLVHASLPYFHHWREVVGGDAGFKQVGCLVLVGENNRLKLVRNLEMLRGIGVNTRQVDPDEVREIQPTVSLFDGALAAYEPESGYADPVATTHCFMRAAVMHGVSLQQGVTVTGIRQQGGRVVGVSSSYGDFDAPLVFCAANIWSPALLEPLGVSLDLWAYRSQKGYFTRPEPLKQRAGVVLDLARDGYSRPHDDQTYAMSCHGGWNGQVDPNAFREDNDPEFADTVREVVGRRVPALADAGYPGGDAGVYDMSPDTRAILDRAPGVEGLFIAAGFSGSGFKLAPMVGACLTELALEGSASSADIQPFRLSRFAENDPIRGEHEYDLPGDWGLKW
jgi:sarcosine oxidase subunit beta